MMAVIHESDCSLTEGNMCYDCCQLSTLFIIMKLVSTIKAIEMIQVILAEHNYTERY